MLCGPATQFHRSDVCEECAWAVNLKIYINHFLENGGSFFSHFLVGGGGLFRIFMAPTNLIRWNRLNFLFLRLNFSLFPFAYAAEKNTKIIK